MQNEKDMFTIGQLAARTGLPVRTIRFWSDSGKVPPSGRSAGGYRLYDSAAVARLDLVRTLRDLGLGLTAIQRVLDQQASLAEVAEAHVAALDTEIRVLRLRRAVLRTVARRSTTTEEVALMHRLAQLSARERQQLIDDFVDTVFADTPSEQPNHDIAQAMRQAAALPDDPSPEQVDAWIELAELTRDEDFRSQLRRMALAGPGASPAGPAVDHRRVLERAGAAVAAGVAPDAPQAQSIVLDILGHPVERRERVRLRNQLRTFTDRRVERYWQLVSLIQGQPPAPAQVPAYEWLTAALEQPQEG